MWFGAYLLAMGDETDDSSASYTSSEYSVSPSSSPYSGPEDFPSPPPSVFPTLSTAAAMLKKNVDLIAEHPKPKRPISGFLKFASHVRPTLLKENPSLNVTQVAKLTALKWKEADEAIKKKFSDEYVEDKKKYETAMSAYNSALSKLDPKVIIAREEEMKKEKRAKMKVLERRAMLKEWVAKMTQEWKNMADSEKQTYQTRYLKAKEEHEESMAKWAKRMCETGNSDVLPKKLIQSPSTSK